MDVHQLYNLIEEFYGYKCQMIGVDTGTQEVTCYLYNSFCLQCGLGDRYGTFGAGIVLGEGYVITTFLGKHCSLNSDEKSIKESLQLIDDWCRLRLPDKFLEAYYKAYVLNQYEDCDL